MGIRDWFNKADGLEVKHKGTPVLSHPANIQVDEEAADEEQGRKAHQAISNMLADLDEEVDEDE